MESFINLWHITKKNVNSITVRTVLGFTKENMNCVKGLEI